MNKTIFKGKIQVKVPRKLVFKLICRFKFHFLFCFAIYSRNNFATHSIPWVLYQMVNQNTLRAHDLAQYCFDHSLQLYNYKSG